MSILELEKSQQIPSCQLFHFTEPENLCDLFKVTQPACGRDEIIINVLTFKFNFSMY
jgi:hypothetical protein